MWAVGAHAAKANIAHLSQTRGPAIARRTAPAAHLMVVSLSQCITVRASFRAITSAFNSFALHCLRSAEKFFAQADPAKENLCL